MCSGAKCSNGILPNLKLLSALVNTHKEKPIFHKPDNLMDWAANAGGKLRMVARCYREVAADEEKLETCLRKAWGLQTKIDWATSKDL